MSVTLETIKELAISKGFDVVGVTNADNFDRDELEALKRIRDGHMDGYSWYNEERVKKMNRPNELLEDAQSIISLACSYLGDSADSSHTLNGRVARYSWGDDYHKVLKERIADFCADLSELVDIELKLRIFVDDGPMNDRAAARRSGVGWVGKNTNILTPSHGSWVLLGQVITNLPLPSDLPLKKSCGNCVRCIDDCPTGAIVAPYVIDNKRCISYLTIELKGVIPRDLRPLMGDWIFGCDICQDVCPVNLKALPGHLDEFKQRNGFSTPDLVPILEMDQMTFSDRYKNSPIKRTKLVGLQRNACIALGNNGDEKAILPLSKVLCSSEESLVRLHAAWAIGRIGGREAATVLERARDSERDNGVLDEINLSLEEISI
ncbi:MAG: tRNA epoxyqueuosine(34) reductase QueG [Dehalococcoidia bacterium]